MVSVNNLIKNQRPATFEWLGVKVNFIYRPGEFNANNENELDKMEKESTTGEAMAVMMNKIIVSWEVEDERGKNQAPTLEFLRTVPTNLLWAVYRACQQDMHSPLGLSSNGSDSTSAPMATEATSPSGTG